MSIKLEYEKKFLLTHDEFYHLKEIFGIKFSQEYEQFNYYYDTPDERLRAKHTTCRIRQKNNLLRGTIKRHMLSDPETFSAEESFAISEVPAQLEIGNDLLDLKGVLYTKRAEFIATKGIKVCFDYNIYLGKTDYELELEYEKNTETIVLGIIDLLAVILQRKLDICAPNKAERFFRKLHTQRC